MNTITQPPACGKISEDLLDAAFRELQHDTGPQDVEYRHQRASLGEAFAKILSHRHPAPVADERNQCDGCRANMPVNASGNHVAPDGQVFMGCSKARYLVADERAEVDPYKRERGVPVVSGVHAHTPEPKPDFEAMRRMLRAPQNNITGPDDWMDSYQALLVEVEDLRKRISAQPSVKDERAEVWRKFPDNVPRCALGIGADSRYFCWIEYDDGMASSGVRRYSLDCSKDADWSDWKWFNGATVESGRVTHFMELPGNPALSAQPSGALEREAVDAFDDATVRRFTGPQAARYATDHGGHAERFVHLDDYRAALSAPPERAPGKKLSLSEAVEVARGRADPERDIPILNAILTAEREKAIAAAHRKNCDGSLNMDDLSDARAYFEKAYRFEATTSPGTSKISAGQYRRYADAVAIAALRLSADPPPERAPGGGWPETAALIRHTLDHNDSIGDGVLISRELAARAMNELRAPPQSESLRAALEHVEHDLMINPGGIVSHEARQKVRAALAGNEAKP